MKVIIDRFEGDYAVVETSDKTMVNIHKTLIPGLREGDIINITLDVEETKKRKAYIKRMMDNLWEE